MKIVHLFNSSVISGPETLVVPSLAKLDLECEVIWLTETRLERAQSVAEYSEQYGLPTVSIPVERRFDRKAIKTLREQLSRGAIDIIHAHDVKASFYALKAVSGLTPRPKLVSTHHGVRGRAGFVSRLYERIYRHLVLPHFDLVLAVCASDRAILEISAGLVDKVRVHWNGVDAPLPLPFHREKRRSELHRQWGVPEEPGSVVVGIVGRLAPEKRVDYALSVFGEVKRRNPDLPLYFVVVGDGPLREELESQVKTQSLMNCVHFLGYRVDFGAEMVGLDVLLSLSRAEGLPINVLEAGYSKTPLLCTRIDGLADLFPFGTGFPALESSAGLPELVDELEKLIRDRELRHRIGSPKNGEKYVGTKTPTYRSSWEHAFMRLCDEHPNVYQWASESIKIPYRHPFTGKYTVYVPDFFIVYQDKEGRKHAEMVEVKPMSQTTMESAGKSLAKKKQVVINMAKWEAASAYAKQRRIKFRVVSEEQLFHSGKRK